MKEETEDVKTIKSHTTAASSQSENRSIEIARPEVTYLVN